MIVSSRSRTWAVPRAVAVLAAACVALSGGACRRNSTTPSAGPVFRDQLIFAAPADATTLDPHNTTDTESDQVTMMVYEPLIAFDDAMKIVPRLAERWNVEADGVTWTTIHWRARA